jgi:pimeloyl-ACP methyl ester carboxylesterase
MKKMLLPFATALLLAGWAAMALSTTTRMGEAQVNGTSLKYIEQGDGVPVVFVHGSMTDQRVWEKQRPAITKGYRYIAYNQRYFGKEPWPDL